MTETARLDAQETARCIAGQPGLNRHSIGEGDRILDGMGEPTGYRMQDFIPEADLATYRTFLYGSPEATATAPCDTPPDQRDDCAGNCAGGHWGPGGWTWHYTRGPLS